MAIRNAYLDILDRDPSHNVTVTMICQDVGINRSTFYAHYEDVSELQTSIEKKAAEELMAILSDKDLGDNRINRQRLAVILDYVKDNMNFYRSCFRSGRMDDMSVIDLISKKMNADERLRYRIVFFKAGIGAVIRSWVDSGCLDSKQFIIDVIMEMYGRA